MMENRINNGYIRIYDRKNNNMVRFEGHSDFVLYINDNCEMQVVLFIDDKEEKISYPDFVEYHTKEYNNKVSYTTYRFYLSNCFIKYTHDYNFNDERDRYESSLIFEHEDSHFIIKMSMINPVLGGKPKPLETPFDHIIINTAILSIEFGNCANREDALSFCHAICTLLSFISRNNVNWFKSSIIDNNGDEVYSLNRFIFSFPWKLSNDELFGNCAEEFLQNAFPLIVEMGNKKNQILGECVDLLIVAQRQFNSEIRYIIYFTILETLSAQFSLKIPPSLLETLGNKNKEFKDKIKDITDQYCKCDKLHNALIMSISNPPIYEKIVNIFKEYNIIISEKIIGEMNRLRNYIIHGSYENKLDNFSEERIIELCEISQEIISILIIRILGFEINEKVAPYDNIFKNLENKGIICLYV